MRQMLLSVVIVLFWTALVVPLAVVSDPYRSMRP